MSSNTVYDLIIVGSGSVGSAAGYYAAKAGLKVLMIDHNTPPHNNGSHHGATRLIRHAYGEGQKYMPMLLRARKLWDELCAITTQDILAATGVIIIGPKDSDFVSTSKNSAVKFKLEAQEFNAGEIENKWPGFKIPADYIGIYESSAGYLRSELAIEHLIRLSKQYGADQLFNCKVLSVKDNDGIIHIVTDKGTYQGRKAAVTSGTWVRALVPQMPVAPIRKVVAWHEADERYGGNFPSFVILVGRENYFGFRKDSVGLKVGKHDGGQPVTCQEQVTPFGSYAEDNTERDEMLAQCLPGVGKVVRGVSCSYDMSPDEDFIIDTLPNDDKILVVTGLSGHGFKFATVLGEIVSLFAQNKKPEFDITPFSLKRFPNVAGL